MSRIAIIDADLIGRKHHNFPNLACMKLSGYYKNLSNDVELKMDYNNLDNYDKIFVSKAFMNTPAPNWLISGNEKHIKIGGTGFFFDRAEPLPPEIEHHMPDYHLYDSVPGRCKEYTDYSIGYLTRGCFRHCDFCVNKNSNGAEPASALMEFLDRSRKKICLLDDNFFAFPHWESLLSQLMYTKKPFRFKQGLDIRLLTDKKCEMLFNCKYDGDYIFAFDYFKDYDLIEEKLKLIRKYYSGNNLKFYVLTGYGETNYYDILDVLRRISLLMDYGAVPYLMRYQDEEGNSPWETSDIRSLYAALARWCNQPAIFKKMSFYEMCKKDQERMKHQNQLCASMREYENLKSWIGDNSFMLSLLEKKYKKWN